MNERRRQTKATLGAGPLPLGRSLRCPHPGKQVYTSKARAKLAIKRASTQGATSRATLHPYRCECGSWHVGHKKGSRQNTASVPRA